MDLALKIILACCTVISLVATLFNVLSAQARAKQLAKERRDDERLDNVCLLAARTDQRVTGIENRVGSFEQRVEKRLDQIADNVSDFNEKFTNFLINHHKS
jgi:biopolymer transport protein ExbB/TolQ